MKQQSLELILTPWVLIELILSEESIRTQLYRLTKKLKNMVSEKIEVTIIL